MRNPPWTRDELILALHLYMKAGRKVLDATHAAVIELSDTLNRLDVHRIGQRGIAFRNANGVGMKLANFSAIDPEKSSKGLERGNRLEQVVWNEFASNLKKLIAAAEAIKAAAYNQEETEGYVDDDEEFPEGKILSRLHKARERNSSVVKKKKSAVLTETGKLACECCGFDFNSVYGSLGHGFAECHHRTPLCDLPSQTKTRLSDLAIVCANCHRMLHYVRPVLTVEELRKHIHSL
jgi:5-methylcytosine-specific restriction protein A